MIITAIGQQAIVMYPPIAWFVAPNYDYHCNQSADEVLYNMKYEEI